MSSLLANNQYSYVEPIISETLIDNLNYFISLNLNDFTEDNFLYDRICKGEIFNHTFYEDLQDSTNSKNLMNDRINEFCTKEEAELIYDFINDFERLVRDLKDK